MCQLSSANQPLTCAFIGIEMVGVQVAMATSFRHFSLQEATAIKLVTNCADSSHDFHCIVYDWRKFHSHMKLILDFVVIVQVVRAAVPVLS